MQKETRTWKVCLFLTENCRFLTYERNDAKTRVGGVTVVCAQKQQRPRGSRPWKVEDKGWRELLRFAVLYSVFGEEEDRFKALAALSFDVQGSVWTRFSGTENMCTMLHRLSMRDLTDVLLEERWEEEKEEQQHAEIVVVVAAWKQRGRFLAFSNRNVIYFPCQKIRPFENTKFWV